MLPRLIPAYASQNNTGNHIPSGYAAIILVGSVKIQQAPDRTKQTILYRLMDPAPQQKASQQKKQAIAHTDSESELEKAEEKIDFVKNALTHRLLEQTHPYGVIFSARV